MKLVMVGRTLSNFGIMSQLLLDGWMGLPTCFWVQFWEPCTSQGGSGSIEGGFVCVK